MRRSNTYKFIQNAINIHGNKYNYSKVNYINNKTLIIIICREHGEFTQRPFNHLKGHECKKCTIINSLSSQISNIKKFIYKANKIHNNCYDYSKVIYVNCNSKIKIICKQHGEFLQTPGGHINGRGCQKCEGNKKLNTSEFIKRSIKIHCDTNISTGIVSCKYDYSEVNYINNRTKVLIICKEHYGFMQTPFNHLRGRGCNKCANLSREIKS